jgi:hypothetical protein
MTFWFYLILLFWLRHFLKSTTNPRSCDNFLCCSSIASDRFGHCDPDADGSSLDRCEVAWRASESGLKTMETDIWLAKTPPEAMFSRRCFPSVILKAYIIWTCEINTQLHEVEVANWWKIHHFQTQPCTVWCQAQPFYAKWLSNVKNCDFPTPGATLSHDMMAERQ